MTLKRGHIEVAHQDLHLEPIDLLPKPVPKGFELVWAQDQIGELVVHVHHHGNVLSSEEAHVVQQGDLRDDAARVCPASFFAFPFLGFPMIFALQVEHLQGATSLISHCNEDAAFFLSSQGEVWKLGRYLNVRFACAFGAAATAAG